jgi:hypothetical protein
MHRPACEKLRLVERPQSKGAERVRVIQLKEAKKSNLNKTGCQWLLVDVDVLMGLFSDFENPSNGRSTNLASLMYFDTLWDISLRQNQVTI